MKTQKHDKLMNTPEKETKPDTSATSGRVQRLVLPDYSIHLGYKIDPNYPSKPQFAEYLRTKKMPGTSYDFDRALFWFSGYKRYGAKYDLIGMEDKHPLRWMLRFQEALKRVSHEAQFVGFWLP